MIALFFLNPFMNWLKTIILTLTYFEKSFHKENGKWCLLLLSLYVMEKVLYIYIKIWGNTSQPVAGVTNQKTIYRESNF